MTHDRGDSSLTHTSSEWLIESKAASCVTHALYYSACACFNDEIGSILSNAQFRKHVTQKLTKVVPVRRDRQHADVDAEMKCRHRDNEACMRDRNERK